jgi:hypothetical protein
MANLGPRYAGNNPHRAYVDFLAREFEGLGLKPKRDRVSFELWEPRRWALRVDDGKGEVDIDVASFFDLSGETPEQGVTGELVWLDGPKPAGSDVNGKICVLQQKLSVPPSQVELFAPSILALGKQTQSEISMGTTPISLGGSAPDLSALRDAGAVGVIIIQEGPELWLNGLWTSYRSPNGGLPALLISPRAGETLKPYHTARLTLFGERSATSADHLSAQITGVSPETIVLLSHTDGPNAIQENGALGVLALAHHLARLPTDQRPRTITLACVEGHLASHEGRDTRGWLKLNQDVQSRTVAFMPMEHMGATEWFAQGKESHATGRPEQSLLSASNHPNVQAAALEAFKRTPMQNTVCIKPLLGGQRGEVMPGLAGGVNGLGIPTVGYITVPPYLLSAVPGNHLDKFDANRLHAEISLLADVFHTMNQMSAERLKSKSA